MSTPAEKLLAFDLCVRPFMEAQRAFKAAKHALASWGGVMAMDAELELPDVLRADGNVECVLCGQILYDHPHDPRNIGARVRCDGTRVHL